VLVELSALFPNTNGLLSIEATPRPLEENAIPKGIDAPADDAEGDGGGFPIGLVWP